MLARKFQAGTGSILDQAEAKLFRAVDLQEQLHVHSRVSLLKDLHILDALDFSVEYY